MSARSDFSLLGFSHCQASSEPHAKSHGWPPETPFLKHPHSQAPGSGPAGRPPHLHPLPDCRSIAAAVSKQLPKELPLSIFLPTGQAGAEILPVSRNPAAVGGRPRPAVTVPCSRAAFVWDSEENNRSYFRLYGSRESPRPSATSKGTATSQGLAGPPGASLGRGGAGGTRSVPSVLSRDVSRAGTMALVLWEG